MEILKRVNEVQERIQLLRKEGNSIAFVPTMGALHEGHISLIKKAQKHADVVVASVFVNPSQFNEKSDLEKYPRTLQADAEKLNDAGCSLLFAPEISDIYPEGHEAKTIDYQGLDEVMEGAKRPGHFDGVVEVVARLFDIVDPDVACFGEKDFQQLAIIKMLVEEHKYDIEVLGCPIIREENGLAMSSRNERLSKEHREKAAILSETLNEMKGLVDLMNPDEVEDWGRSALNGLDFCELEYLEVAEAKTLQPIFRWHECESARAFVVARFGEIRLIDNLEIYRQAASI